MYMAIITRPIILLSILYISMFAYASYPFLNGLGCDFSADVFEDEYREVHISCFAGAMTEVYRTKATNRMYVTHSVYGKKGDSVLLLPLWVEYINSDSDDVALDGYWSDYVHTPNFMSFKAFEGEDSFIFLWDTPVMEIYKAKKVGRLSFF